MISDYKSLSIKAKEILQEKEIPLKLKNGHIWQVNDRVQLWNDLGGHLFVSYLKAFQDLAISILSERNPAFELQPKDRYLANVHQKTLRHSEELRKGVAEGLAIMGSNPEALVNCPISAGKYTADSCVRIIFEGADWVLWASLGDLLPALSEASPDEFLDAVDNALQADPCPFDELFAQEGDGFLTGGSYIAGLLWALEALAWDEVYLVRVCNVLGELAQRDPGGKMLNRPANSLSTILLPWFPQTKAPFEKRKVVVSILTKEVPDVAWELIINLLPNQVRSSSGSHKPVWRFSVPEDLGEASSRREFIEQSLYYADLAISEAGYDIARLLDLISISEHLPESVFEQLLERLSSNEIVTLPETERLSIWNSLEHLIVTHKRFQHAEWSIKEKNLHAVEKVANKLGPSEPVNLYHHLFSCDDFDLYEENENWEEQRKKIDEKRQEAVTEIVQDQGIDGILEFIEKVKFSEHVGQALGHVANDGIDNALLPTSLCSKNKKLSTFISAYVWCRRYVNGWEWLDNFDISQWTVSQIMDLLRSLPFAEEAWDRAHEWLGESDSEYWVNVNANPYSIDSNIEYAVTKLIEYKRPHAAILCLAHMQREEVDLDIFLCVKALLEAVSSSEGTNNMSSYHIENLIEFLQDNESVSANDMLLVEWAYLPILGSHHKLSPRFLEEKLASEPEFFCEIIQLIYRSQNDKNEKQENSKDKQAIAKNAWKLLFDWATPPRVDLFSNWIAKVKAISEESGHLDVALTHAGQVLFYSPLDPDGLWIHRVIAEALNHKDAQKMRDGYSTETFNSRGVHFVDPTGKPEREFAEKYREKSKQIEDAGYQRFAVTLRKIAEKYDWEAERIVSDHKDFDS